MAERDHIHDGPGTESEEAMHTDATDTDATHTDATHTDATHTDATHTDATHTDMTGTAVPPIAGDDEPLRPGTAVPPTGVITGDAMTPGVTHDVITTDDPAPSTRRRGPDPLTLLVGLATLAMAVFAFIGDLPDLSGFDPRWLLAGGAAVVGLVLLVGNLRGRSGGRRGGS